MKVVGVVGLAGKVIEGTQGWRAERGRIKELYLPPHHWRAAKALRDLYGIPVKLARLESLIAEGL